MVYFTQMTKKNERPLTERDYLLSPGVVMVLERAKARATAARKTQDTYVDHNSVIPVDTTTVKYPKTRKELMRSLVSHSSNVTDDKQKDSVVMPVSDENDADSNILHDTLNPPERNIWDYFYQFGNVDALAGTMALKNVTGNQEANSAEPSIGLTATALDAHLKYYLHPSSPIKEDKRTYLTSDEGTRQSNLMGNGSTVGKEDDMGSIDIASQKSSHTINSYSKYSFTPQLSEFSLYTGCLYYLYLTNVYIFQLFRNCLYLLRRS